MEGCFGNDIFDTSLDSSFKDFFDRDDSAFSLKDYGNGILSLKDDDRVQFNNSGLGSPVPFSSDLSLSLPGLPKPGSSTPSILSSPTILLPPRQSNGSFRISSSFKPPLPSYSSYSSSSNLSLQPINNHNALPPVISQLPSVLAPMVTSQVQMRSTEDTEVFLLGCERKIERPVHSNTARKTVLNALRTIVPSRGVFKVADVVIDLLIYDFYYRGTELRMLIILLDTQEVFDAFAFQQDVLHLLVSCSALITYSDTTNWGDYLKKDPGFDFFYIKCQQVNKYQSLNRAICSAAKSMKFNDSLLNWITGSTRSFLSVCKVTKVPISWKPLPGSLAPKLFTTPQLSALDKDSKCLHLQRTGDNCACDDVKSDYNRELKIGTTTGLWSYRRLLPYLFSTLEWPIRRVLQPCMADIRSLQISKLAASSKPSSLPKLIQTREECNDDDSSSRKGSKNEENKAKKQKVRPSFHEDGRRILCCTVDCTELASVYWLNCCNHTQPVMCRHHSSQLLLDSEFEDMVKCPVHHISGRIADLL